MAIAVVCTAFDAGGDGEVAAVRALVRSLGGRAASSPAHRPHLTLSAASVEDASVITKVAARVAKRHEPFRLRLTSVGTFGRGDVVWLAPSRSAALTALQRDMYSSLIDAGFPPAFAGQSHPRSWQAHCTIARRIPPDVLRELDERFIPIDVMVTAVATVVVGGKGDVGYAPMPARKRARR